MKLTSVDRAKLIPMLALRWSRLLVEDAKTEGFWKSVREALGRPDLSPNCKDAQPMGRWVMWWAAAITRIFV